MSLISIIVKAQWDDDANVWCATSNDIQGLSLEAATLEDLQSKLTPAICDLIEMNGMNSDLAEIPVHLMAESLMLVSNPCR